MVDRWASYTTILCVSEKEEGRAREGRGERETRGWGRCNVTDFDVFPRAIRCPLQRGAQCAFAVAAS